MSGFEILSSPIEFIYCAENTCPIQTVIEESWTQRLWQNVGKSQGNQRNSGVPGRPEQGAVSSQAQGESRWVEKVLDSRWGLWKRNTANRQLPGRELVVGLSVLTSLFSLLQSLAGTSHCWSPLGWGAHGVWPLGTQGIVALCLLMSSNANKRVMCQSECFGLFLEVLIHFFWKLGYWNFVGISLHLGHLVFILPRNQWTFYLWKLQRFFSSRR